MKRALLAVALAACSSSKPAPARPPTESPPPSSEPAQLGSPWAPDLPGKCADRQWGGWDGTPECAATKARIIVGADRACSTDADCVKPFGGNCDDNVISTAAAPRYADWPAPCGDPTSGDCSPSRPMCASGCCLSWN